MRRVINIIITHADRRCQLNVITSEECCGVKNRKLTVKDTVCVTQARQELEKIRRRLEAELADLREQLNEKSSQLEELQAQMNKREEELQRALNRSVDRTACLSLNAISNCFNIIVPCCFDMLAKNSECSGICEVRNLCSK